MAVTRGPRIVTDGLVLCLDAADRNSYAGVGNLVRNGYGLTGTNANFSTLTYDSTDRPGRSGSFKYTGASTTIFSDDLMTVDVNQSYYLTMYAKAGNTGGSGYYSQNLQYAGIVCIDADQNIIYPYYFMKYSGATDTTLANALNTGDSTITLTNGTGWATTGAQTYERQIMWWPYTNTQGYTYADYTYSRNSSINNANYSTNGCWSSRTGNVLTLTQTWPGPNLAAGTKVANGTSGGTYNYALLGAYSVPNTWSLYSATISGVDTNRVNDPLKFRPGTAYAKIMFLPNYTSSPATPSDAIIKYANLSFKDIRGNICRDLSGGNYNGTAYGEVPYSAEAGGCFDFAAVTGSFPSNATFGFTFASNMVPTTGNFTISTWIKNPPASAGQSGLFSNAGSGDGYRFGIGKDGVYWLMGPTYAEGGVVFLNTLNSTSWYNVTAIFARSEATPQIRVYLNGVFQNSNNFNASQTAFTNTAPGLVRSPCCLPIYNGKLATFNVYNRTLSINEIKQNYDATKSRFGL